MTAVEVLASNEFVELDSWAWLTSSEPELFREYMLSSPSLRAPVLAERLAAIAHSDIGEVFRVTSKGRPLAVVGIEEMTWDSNHFGVRCGRIGPYCISDQLEPAKRLSTHQLIIDACLGWAIRKDVKVLQRRLLSRRLPEIHVLEEKGFHLADNVVTMSAPAADVLNSPIRKDSRIRFRHPNVDDLRKMQELTRGAFACSRFVNDETLSPQLGDELYVKWITKTFHDIAANEDMPRRAGILIAILEDEIAGYVSFQIVAGAERLTGKCVGAIELIVVAEPYRGHGVGQSLVVKAACELVASGAEVIEASTWINQIPAMLSNQRAGLRVRESLFTYLYHR